MKQKIQKERTLGDVFKKAQHAKNRLNFMNLG